MVVRLEPEIVTLLKRLGLKRIGQLYALPRTSLERRFHAKETAEAVLCRLDQALGRPKEPRAPLLPSPDFVARFQREIKIAAVGALFVPTMVLALTALSLALTPREVRERNGFSWAPISEVAKLFAGIFLTVIPVIAMLQAGRSGGLANVVALVTDSATGAPSR